MLLTKALVKHEMSYYESPLKAWIRENAAVLIAKRNEILEFGLWIVTSTWTTEECAINVWNWVGKEVNVGFKTCVVEIGELAPSGEWWLDGQDGGWIKAKALDVSFGRDISGLTVT